MVAFSMQKSVNSRDINKKMSTYKQRHLSKSRKKSKS